MKLPVADSAALRAHTGVLLRRHRAGLGRVLVLHTLAATAGLAGPWLLGRMVDAVAEGTTTTVVDQAVGVLVLAVLAQTVLIRYAQRGAMVLGETVFAQLREQFVGTVTRLPLSTVERAGTGDLVARTTNDIDRVQHTIRFGVPRVLVTAATIVLTLAAAVAVSWQVAIALLAGLPLLLVTTRWYLRRAAAGYLRESASYARLNGTITESVEGARTVDALGLGRRRRERVDADLREAFDAESYTLWLRTILFPGVDLSFVMPVVATVAWGAWLVSTGSASVGAVTTIAVYALQVMHPIGELIYWLDEIQVGATSLARIIGVEGVAPDRVARRESRPADEHVVASAVRYAYREGHDVLHGVDLDLGVGERLAVVGPSGAGKSTLGRMLAGIHPPTGGTVTVGDAPLVDLPLDELRGHVALVTQEHHVFVGTVEQNLRLAKPEADDAELRRALAAVDADWVDALPDGLATEVGSGGVVLTPAQAQQVALARLVLLDPHTLVLDEATSLLDPRAARHLERSLSAVLEGRTVVAIAHRLHTAHDADRVAVVDGGRITEIGSHDELVAAGGDYAALWRSWQRD